MHDVCVGATPELALKEWTFNGSVSICIPDHTRPMDVTGALEALSYRVSSLDSVVVGLGLHRQMTTEELAPIQSWNPIQHDPDAVVPIGAWNGLVGEVSTLVMSAEISIVVGVAELHQYAGISSGYKGVVVGCGGRRTISGLHSRQQVLAPGVCVGQIKDNPFRIAIDELGKLTNCRFALVYIPACEQWAFGHPKRVIEMVGSLLNPWEWVEKKYSKAIVRVPDCKASSLYQASRAASYLGLSPNPPLADGAQIIIEANLEEGLGSEAGFVNAISSTNPPWSRLLSGPPPVGPGAQRAVVLALMAKRFELVIRACQNPLYFKKLGFDASSQSAVESEDSLIVRDVFSQIPQWRG